MEQPTFGFSELAKQASLQPKEASLIPQITIKAYLFDTKTANVYPYPHLVSSD
jgi:hypothetical protein